MRAASRTAEEEEAFLSDIFSDSIFAELPSPDPPGKHANSNATLQPQSPLRTPSRRRKLRSTPSPKRHSSSSNNLKSFRATNEDVEQLTAGLDWDDFSDYNSSLENASPMATSMWCPEPCTRCVVISVTDESYVTHIFSCGLLILLLVLEVESTRTRCTIVLRDSWANSQVQSGDIVNVIGHFMQSQEPSSSKYKTQTISITMHDNLLIIHPDVLITPTALAAAPHCQRKPLMTALLRSSPSSPHTPSLLYGNVLHEVVQACLVQNRWDAPFIDQKVEENLQSSLGELLRVDVRVEEAKQAILERGKAVGIFGGRYIGSANAVVNNYQAERGQVDTLAITKLNDVEDDIWSPKYGLKGKLDASVQVTIHTTLTPSSQGRKSVQEPTVLSGTVPLELKTGRASALEHRAQTMLYTLLLSDRYSQPVPVGLLFYTQAEDVTLVHRARNEIRGLVIMRNEMAGWLIKRSRQNVEHAKPADEAFLPETIDDERLCSRCYALDACMLYRKAVENVEDTTSPIASIYDAKTSHLTPTHTAFFKKWESLIALEEADMLRFRKELWTLGARERAVYGRCFANMILDTTFTATRSPSSGKEGKINRHIYRFRRWDPSNSMDNLLSGHIGVGDPITVSVEPDLLALARGYVVSLSVSEVTLGLDHALDEAVITSLLRARGVSHKIVYRVDKDELASGMGRIRDNLAALFYPGGDAKRRRLIVDLEAPVFQPPHPSQFASPHLANLNSTQLAAVDKVLRAEDYALVMGMPGTGKTTVVAQLIKYLVGTGKTVLLSAYTHSAVDTILAKLHDADFGILRLGNADKVHPDAKKYLLSARLKARTVEELERQLMTPPVVATTALSLDQLRLSEAHPASVAQLNMQYRMSEDIMSLVNKVIYDGRLQCGNEVVAAQTLRLPSRSFLESLHSGCGGPEDCWLEQVLSQERRVVFLNTDQIPARESRVGDLVQNPTEAELTRQLVEVLVRSGIPKSSIGIISVYRQQIKLLTQELVHYPTVEILTADRSQGRDKDCIIVSMVRSNDSAHVGDLVKDWRRMNVAFTRARSKLIIIGSWATLQLSDILFSFLNFAAEKGWVLTLPPKAHALHTVATKPSLKRAQRSDDEIENEVTTSVPATPEKGTKKRKGAVMPGGIGILKDLRNELDSP
ncbi:Dna2-domain-containing protein [Vararia minispora EC-137]|uniref:Dna2-domain-containing protein n=1 Tax=Vararia minispora EC-137 TaxID=1314806 RepID=A0ACB8QDU0_9AGAM|nr:Dna2-domain-containing protein [Vararia minispora EC-137]